MQIKCKFDALFSWLYTCLRLDGFFGYFGTVLGVLLISLIKGNLILLGVSGSWQRAAVGALLLIGITVQALNESKKAKNRRVSTSDEAGE